jgi:chaperonin cofactor prefoldin
MNLYTLTANELELLRMLEDGQDVGDTLESVQELSTDKLEGYAKVLKTLEANAEALKTEAKRMKDVETTCRNGVDRMKKAIYDHMQVTGKKKVDGRLFKFSIAKNPPSLLVMDESLIPEIFFKEQEPILDKKLLLDELKDGFEFDGVKIKQGESLRIR